MKKFPSIEQFRNIIKQVNYDYKEDAIKPTIKFTGTVKLHGTNAAIVKYKDGHIEFQSRERILSLHQDNAQFMLNMLNKDLDYFFKNINFKEYVAVYGEWCGQGIQKGVAISEIEKSFFIFACMVDDRWVEWKRSMRDERIYNIKFFPYYEIDIDFNYPELSQNKLQELTLEVEKECPVGRSFGISGIGEGICWASQDRKYVFKVKGEKHSVSKVKTLASVDVEMVNNIKEFIENTVTENRLLQGIEKLKEMGLEISQKSTGEFLRWVVGDIIKEEQDTIVKNQLDPKKMNGLISEKARKWFFNNI